MPPSDHDLLRAYAEEGSQAAFAELVRRHVDLVYSAARRQLSSPQLAEDVAQSVFLDLAREARRIAPNQPLAAWLHVVTRRTAVDVIRRESRQRAREQQAAALAEPAMKESSTDWESIEPLLDEAVDSLNAADRVAILLRFFENKSLRDVGRALGTSDDAAQKRVTRALEQLRGFFLRRGIAITAAGLATDLSARGLGQAPAGLGSAIATAGAKIVPAAALPSTAATLAMTTTQKIGIAAAFAAAAVTAYEATVVSRQGASLDAAQRQFAALTSEVDGLRAALSSDASRLQLAQAQIEARRAALAASSVGNDAALEAQMKAWLGQLDQLRRFLGDNPRFSIPELQLLSEEDWFAVASGGNIASETDFRRASAALRDRAEGIFASKLSGALAAFVRANNDLLPQRPRQLAAYFNPPIDPAQLDRYEMLHQGKASDVAPQERMKLITAKPVDLDYDNYRWVGIDGYGNNGNLMGYNVTMAKSVFRRAMGREAVDATELGPYLKWPVDAAALQKYLDRDANGGEP